VIAKFWWIVHKDLVSECRGWRVWPAMLLFGIVVALAFNYQMDLPPQYRAQILGGLVWLAIFFAGMLAVDRSFASEREDGCWDGLMLCPMPPVNVVALGAVQLVLLPLFVAFSDVPLLDHPWALLVVAILGNLGLAAVGTLLSALATGIRQSSGLLVLLVLPLVIPVVLGAAEATRLIAEHRLDAAWWGWVQLLGAFAVVFLTVASLLFDLVVEE
jgi:heme exporter protein B